jgi:S1-C subfamily serine protease
VIQRADGKEVTTSDQLRKLIQDKKPGAMLNLDVWSAGVKRLVNVKVQERPADIGAMQQQPPEEQQP